MAKEDSERLPHKMVKLWIYCVITVFKPNSIHNYKSEGYGDFMDLEFLMFIVTEVNIEQKSAFRPSFVKDG